MSAVIAKAFEAHRVTDIFGIADRDNAASIGLMRRLGMTFVEHVDAGGVPSVVYRIERCDGGGFSMSR